MAALPPYRPGGVGGGGSNGIGMGNMAVGAVRMENFMAELPRSIFSWDGRNRTLSHDPAAAVVVSDMPLFRNALASGQHAENGQRCLLPCRNVAMKRGDK
ncbi:hypothetical protein Bbelb_113650 [Branchiostoma belcheri]|nr:hypothetical protein Bbelb_113650 [Branchiostoma belcheri]